MITLLAANDRGSVNRVQGDQRFSLLTSGHLHYYSCFCITCAAGITDIAWRWLAWLAWLALVSSSLVLVHLHTLQLICVLQVHM